MLILTRRPGERIRIGDDVTVTILGVDHNKVRIGIDAPISISVHRQEIYERIHNEAQSVLAVAESNNNTASEAAITGASAV